MNSSIKNKEDIDNKIENVKKIPEYTNNIHFVKRKVIDEQGMKKKL